MKRINSVAYVVAFAISVLALSVSGTALAHEDGEAGHHDTKKGEAIMPENYSIAITALEQKRDAIGKLIETGKLADLHKAGEEVKMIAQMLAKLASRGDSGVAKSDIKEINLTAKALAATYEPLDEAGDNGKKDEAKKVFGEMTKLIETLKKFAKK